VWVFNTYLISWQFYYNVDKFYLNNLTGYKNIRNKRMALTRFVNALKKGFFVSDKSSKIEAMITDINASARLTEVQEEISASNMPLKNTTLKTIESLWQAYDGTRPVTGKDIQNAVFIDSPKEYPVIKALLNRGAICTKKDIELIKNFDEPAADFLYKISRL
jgi:hypothetical protein